MKTSHAILLFFGGVVVGGVAVLQLRESQSSCCKRVGEGLRTEVVDAAGPAGPIAGGIYDALNVKSVAGPLLDLFGVPYDA